MDWFSIPYYKTADSFQSSEINKYTNRNEKKVVKMRGIWVCQNICKKNSHCVVHDFSSRLIPVAVPLIFI